MALSGYPCVSHGALAYVIGEVAVHAAPIPLMAELLLTFQTEHHACKSLSGTSHDPFAAMPSHRARPWNGREVDPGTTPR
jgi:hypothetical protein